MHRSVRRRTLHVGAAVLLTMVVIAGILPVNASAATREGVLASQLTALVNRERSGRSLRTLRVDTGLVSVARWRSIDMSRRGYFAHQIPPSGRLVFSELDRRGYCYTVAGENIGWNLRPDAEAAKAIHAMFLASPKHRKIELGSWTSIGIGVSIAPDGKRYWTVLFSKPC